MTPGIADLIRFGTVWALRFCRFCSCTFGAGRRIGLDNVGMCSPQDMRGKLGRRPDTGAAYDPGAPEAPQRNPQARLIPQAFLILQARVILVPYVAAYVAAYVTAGGRHRMARMRPACFSDREDI